MRRLMKSYMITSQTTDILQQQLQIQKPDYALYRDKSNLDYAKDATSFINLCKKYPNTKSFIHQDVALAYKLKSDGVHLTSLQFDEIEKAKGYNLEVIISTHTHEEVIKAQELGADAVTYSPIFASPNKGEPKGIKDLETLLESCVVKVFALGGIISKKHLNILGDTSCYGFASIRYFREDK